MKRLKGSKRAMIFNISIVITTFIVLIYGYMVLSNKMDVDKEIGENPSELIMKYQDGEKTLIFVDLASKLALNQALYDLQSQGGTTTSTACGNYYGFNMWNSQSGQTCYMDSEELAKSLEKYFEGNMLARIAAFPNADFMVNTPQAASFARQATTVTPAVTTGTGGSGYCSGTQQYQKDFTYGSSSGNYPTDGARVFIPAEANCAGSRPLIIYLHGCQSAVHNRFGDGDPYDVTKVAQTLYSARKIEPIIFAAPSQTGGLNKANGCIGTLWPTDFDASKFVEEVKKNLPNGITISSVSVAGHSSAGCSLKDGLYGTMNKIPNLKAIAAIDTCMWPSLFTGVKSKLSATNLLVVYGTNYQKRDEVNNVLGAKKRMTCPAETNYPGGEFDDCFSDESGKILTFNMKNRNHQKAVAVGMEQFLLKFFAAAPATQVSTTTVAMGLKGCIKGQKVAAWGDSITASKPGWVALLGKRCPMQFDNLGVVGRWSLTGRKLFESKVLSKGYNQVIIMFGMNDLLGKRTAESIEGDLQYMYDAAKAKGLRVVAMTVTPAGPSKYHKFEAKKQAEMDKLNQWILSKPRNVDAVVNTWQPLNAGSTTKAANKDYIYPDNIHPNPKGDRILADTIYNTAFQMA